MKQTNTFKTMEMRGYPRSFLHLVLPNDTDLIIERLDNHIILNMISRALSTLPTRSREIICLRCEECYTFQKIGDNFGFSRVHAKRLFDSAIKELSTAVEIEAIRTRALNTRKKSNSGTMIVTWKETRT